MSNLPAETTLDHAPAVPASQWFLHLLRRDVVAEAVVQRPRYLVLPVHVEPERRHAMRSRLALGQQYRLPPVATPPVGGVHLDAVDPRHLPIEIGTRHRQPEP